MIRAVRYLLDAGCWNPCRKNTDGLVYDSETNAFVDKDRKKVIDLSEYTHVEDNVPVFTNGYALLLVQNPDGDTYYNVVDKE